MRRDLQTTTVAAQRVQIALYRLQLQDAAVARMTKLIEDAHSTLASLASDRKNVVAQIERLEEQRNRTPDARERRAIEEEALPEFKRRLEQLAKEEERWRRKATEAEGQLNLEQQKLDALHALLDQLDQALQNVGWKGENTASH